VRIKRIDKTELNERNAKESAELNETNNEIIFVINTDSQQHLLILFKIKVLASTTLMKNLCPRPRF